VTQPATERIRTAALLITNQLPPDAHVHLQAYDLLGRKVATLFDGRTEVETKSFQM